MEIQELTEWMLWLLCPVHRSTSLSPNIPVVLIAVAMELCMAYVPYLSAVSSEVLSSPSLHMDPREGFLMAKISHGIMCLLWPSLLSNCSEHQEPWDVEWQLPFPVSLTQSETCSYLWGLGALPAFLCAQPDLQVLSPVLFLSVSIC